MDPRLVLLVLWCFIIQSSYGKDLRLKLTTEISSAVLDPTQVTQISQRPRAFLYTGFLTDKECDHLILLAKDKLERSMVVGDNNDERMESEVRTSYGMFLQKAQDEIVSDIEARVAAWTFLPDENAEEMQILQYEYGQKYEPHFDYSEDKAHQEIGGNRVATVLMYLSDVIKGGETVFPKSETRNRQLMRGDDDWSECAKQGYAVKPRKGDALLFFSLHPNGTTDPSSLHGSCPVIEGEKWSATKWIHARSFEEERESSECVDRSHHCLAWAFQGECKKNPSYMVGSKGRGGHCRKSCKACSSV